MNTVEELRYLILAVQREGNRRFAQELRPLGLTPAQAEVVRVLDERTSLTLTGLGELLVCETGHSPSRLVDRLVNAGLIDRQPSTRDRRYIELTLTEQGTKLAAAIAEIEEHLHTAIRAALTGHDAAHVTGFLWSLAEGTPPGEALALRARAISRQSAPA